MIKSIRLYNQKSFTAGFLLDWLEQNQVLQSVIFDPKKTHLQLVQRSNDIMRLMLQEDKMTLEVMNMFWALTKGEYKFEIYNILNEIAMWFK